MANKTLFQTLATLLAGPKADAVNAAGGKAYALTARQALAQYAATGCLNHTFYADAETQLTTVLELCTQVEPAFVAKTAISCRDRAHMKDMPALMLAYLAARHGELFTQAFARVIDNGRMLRTFVQILRSGATGRKSLGTAPKRLVQRWLAARSEDDLFAMSIGNDPSLADIVKMVHPKPASPVRAAFYGWLLGKKHDAAQLPESVRAFEAWKLDRSLPLPDVPFQMLTALALDDGQWARIAETCSWQTLRMNLNTFARHGVFARPGMAEAVARRLRDEVAIRRSRVFPYQLMAAWASIGDTVPAEVREALQDAMQVALHNVPEISGRIVICPDVSGSMRSAVTGSRTGATSAVSCLDVAALVASAFLARNRSAEVLAFSDTIVPCRLNPRDAVLTNAAKLAALPSGGTNCSAPLAEINRREAAVDLVILVSDNESWIDARRGQATAVMQEWAALTKRCPRAKLVCLDLQPNATTQAPERADVLNIGGFSDAVFDLIARFAADSLSPQHWVDEIEAVAI